MTKLKTLKDLMPMMCDDGSNEETLKAEAVKWIKFLEANLKWTLEKNNGNDADFLRGQIYMLGKFFGVAWRGI